MKRRQVCRESQDGVYCTPGGLVGLREGLKSAGGASSGAPVLLEAQVSMMGGMVK